MGSVMDSKQVYNKVKNLFKTVRESIWGHCTIPHCNCIQYYQVSFKYCLHFVFLFLFLNLFGLYLFVTWLNVLVYSPSLYQCFMNVSAWWNAVDNNRTSLLNPLHLPCYAKSTLFDSSERNILLLLLFCILQSPFCETWLYIGVGWKYVKSYFRKSLLLSQKQCNTSENDITLYCASETVRAEVYDVYRSIDTRQAQKQMNQNLVVSHETSTKKSKSGALILGIEPSSFSHSVPVPQAFGGDGTTENAPIHEQGEIREEDTTGGSVERTSRDFGGSKLQNACMVYHGKQYKFIDSYLSQLRETGATAGDSEYVL